MPGGGVYHSSEQEGHFEMVTESHARCDSERKQLWTVFLIKIRSSSDVQDKRGLIWYQDIRRFHWVD